MNSHFRLFIFITCLFISSFGFAQKGITITETLTYLNNKMNGKCKFDIKNTRLIISFFKEEEMYRKDQAYCSELDLATLKYSPEEKFIYIKCGAETKDCVIREIFRDKLTRNYGRTGFDVSELNEVSISGIQKAITHLINLMLDVKYESSEPFETSF